MSRKRRCAVCGKVATYDKFGNGTTVPRTTCLDCKEKIAGFAEVKTIMAVKRIVRGVRRLFRVESVEPKEIRLKPGRKTTHTGGITS